MAIAITEIITYPIKSTAGLALKQSHVSHRGLQYDRHWALFDADDLKVITARDYPQLLALSTALSSETLTVKVEGRPVLSIPLTPPASTASNHRKTVTVFGDVATGVEIDPLVSQWFTDYLGKKCHFIFMSDDSRRDLAADRGGLQGDVVSYADECPLLLISEASLHDLNERLSQPVSPQNFRPNIVVSGCEPFAEDRWTRLKISDVLFSAVQRCQRCVFTTIDPITRIRDRNQEPLRTLSTYRRHPDGGVAFGIHLVPRRLGTISIDDKLTLI